MATNAPQATPLFPQSTPRKILAYDPRKLDGIVFLERNASSNVNLYPAAPVALNVVISVPSPFTLSLVGIASAAAIGSESVAASLADLGIASGASVGNESIAASIADIGITSAARVGNQAANPAIDPTGIPTGARLGNTVVFSGIILYPTAIPSGARIGDQALAPSIGAVGIPAGTKIGSSSFSTSIFTTGVASGAKPGNEVVGASINDMGIKSSAAIGNESITSSLKSTGIPSGATVGSESTALSAKPAGIASGVVVGLPSLAEVLKAIGIPLGGAVGIAQIVPQTFSTLYLVGIPSSSEVGNLAIWYVPQITPPPLADAIYQYVSQVLESVSDPPTIIWEFEGGPRPLPFPYLSLNIVRSHSVGQGYQSPIATDVGAQGVFFPKDWTVRMSAWGSNARDFVEAIRQSLEAPWWIDTLETLGLSYRDMTQPRSVNRIIDFSPEHGWSMDVTFGVTAELAQSIAAWIEFAIISGTIVAPDGTKQVLPPVTVGQ